MNGALNRMIGSLKSFFAPVVEKGSKQPIVVSDGLASIVAVLLIVVLGALVPGNFDWLITGIILTLLAFYIWMDWQTRHA